MTSTSDHDGDDMRSIALFSSNLEGEIQVWGSELVWIMISFNDFSVLIRENHWK